MATGTTSNPEKEIKVEGENASRKDDVKVTDLLSEIRTTELPKESPTQVDKSTEKDIIKEGGDKAAEKKDTDNGEGKDAEENKKAENNTDDVRKSDSGDKKADGSKKIEKGEKKLEDGKKIENGDKKSDRNNKTSGKREHVSPLAAFFKDWDKFSTKQKIDIEKFIIDKAEQLGAPGKPKPGVRTTEEVERSRLRWIAMKKRREAARRRSEALRARERRLSSRFRGAGDSRSRYGRDESRWSRYSPRREAVPWRSPWATSQAPVESLLKQMERFVQMFPIRSAPLHAPPPRLALLPTPPNGYISSRPNGLHNPPIEDKSHAFNDGTFSPPHRWAVQPLPVNGEDPSRRFHGKEPPSKMTAKQRPSPYPTPALRNGSWSSRERSFPPPPYQESRYSWRRK